MRKKLVAVLGTFVLAMGMLTACGGTDDGASQTTATESGEGTEVSEEASAERTQLVVGFDASFPPYGYMDDNGDYVGFDLSLAQEVCTRQGWELVKQPIDWDAKDMELTSGTIDCIWNGFTMNGREDQYTWSSPYVDNSQVFVVTVDGGVQGTADLAGKVIAVQKDSSALAALNDEANADLLASFAEVIEYGDYNTAFMDLEAGAVDCVAMDIGVADYQMEARETEFVILDEHLATEQYGVGFALGNEELRDIVEATLMEMVADGTFMQIATEWGLEDSVCLGN